jgi:hypothetical protein
MIDWILIGVVLIWLTAATISDIKTKEVPDWLNFSLIAIGLAIFATKSILEQSYWPILHSLLYVGIFLIIGNIMYYTKQWGGGDAKLLIGIGAILPVYPSLLRNFFNSELTINLPVTILINLIIVGSVYGLFWTVFLIIKHRNSFSKEFKKIKQKKKQLNKVLLILLLVGILISFIAVKELELRIIFSTIFAIPLITNYLLTITKAIEKTSMYKKMQTSNLREGDWITKKIIIDGKTIYSPKSTGVTNKQIEIIKKHKKEVVVKEGIVFIPVFLIATIISLIYGNIFLLFI